MRVQSKPRYKLLTRLISMMLVLLMVSTSIPLDINTFNNPETVYAGVGGSVGGGGSGSMGGAGGDYKRWNYNDSGYRFYIIDKNLTRVSNILDITFRTPSLCSTVVKTTRFDSATSPTGLDRYLYNETTLKNLFSETMVNAMPRPTTYDVGQGTQFREWFLKNLPQQVVNDSGSNAGSTNILSGSNYNKGYTTNNKVNTSSQPGSSSSGNTNNTYNAQLTNESSYIKAGKNLGSTVISELMANAPGGAQTPKSKAFENTVSSTVSGVRYGIYGTYNTYYKKYWDHKKAHPAESSSAAAAKQYALGACYYTFTSVPKSIRATVIKRSLKGFGISVSNQIYQDDLLHTNIPLSETTSVTGCPALDLLNSNLLKVAGFDTPAEALITHDYYLVVEPITWLYLHNGSSYASYGNKTYGSYENLISRWGGSDTGGFYYTYMTTLGNNCLTLTNNFTTSASKTLTMAPIQFRNISTSKANIAGGMGLSMHLYSGMNDLNMQEDKANTSTYDDPKGNTPAPAPDDSSELKNVPSDPTDPEAKTGEPKYANIVKFYEYYENDKLIYNDSFTRTPTPKHILIEDEPQYKVVDWYTSETYKSATGSTPRYDSYKQSMTVVKSGKEVDDKDGEVVKLGKETTLYVKLVLDTNYTQSKGDWTISESRLTKIANTDPTELSNKLLADVQFKAKVIGKIDVTLQATDIDELHRTKFTDEVWGSKVNKVKATSSGAVTLKGFKEQFLVHRNGVDYAQQYTGAVRVGVSTAGPSESANTKLAELGFKMSKVPLNSRALGSATRTLKLSYLVKETSGVTRVDTTPYSTEGELVINSYGGSSSGGYYHTDYKKGVMTVGADGFNTSSGVMTPSKGFTFYPFIQMQYDTLEAQNNLIYVTGAWQRGMQVNDYAEVSWNKTSGNNLHLTSNQWSTHVGALQLASKYTTEKNVMLPGGAIYSLDTKGSDQTVQVATYQTILDAEGLQQAEYDTAVSDELKLPFAKTSHNNFVDDVVESLETLGLVQYVSKDPSKSTAWDKGKVVSSGSDIKFLENGSSNASSDSKYYLSSDLSGVSALAGENDLDVKKGSTITEFYTFYSTVTGDIYVTTSHSEKGTKILSKGENASKINQSTALGKKAKQINTRTLVVDKLVAAIERNTGNDKSAPWASGDGKWYNEAFNGVTVVVQKTALTVGLKSPNLRSTILDPKLIPKQTSKETLFDKAFLSQYKTSDTPVSTGIKNVVGEFKGQQVTVNNLDMLFWSNKFYIPNATVQDLS